MSEEGLCMEKKKGGRGKRVHLYTNYLRVFITHPDRIRAYRTTFKPRIHDFELKQQIIGQFEERLGKLRVYDGRWLFLPFELDVNKGETETILEAIHPKHSHILISVKLYFEENNQEHLKDFFNTLIRRMMTSLGKIQIQRKSFHDSSVKFDIPEHKLQIWPGICTKVELQEDGYMLCLDTSYRIFRLDTVADYINAVRDDNDFRSKVENYFLCKTVVTRYNNFTYRVDDFDWDSTPLSIFTYKHQQLSYKDYYKKRYDIDIVLDDQPLLISRVNWKSTPSSEVVQNIIHLVPELCFETGMSEDQLNNPDVKKSLTRYTFCSPAQKLRALQTFVKRINEVRECKELLKSWDVVLDSDLAYVEGREIPGPPVKFNSHGECVDSCKPKFDSNVCKEICTPVSVEKKWLVISTQKDRRNAQNFAHVFQHWCARMEINILKNAEIRYLKGSSPSDFRDALLDYVDPDVVQFVVVIMPFARKEIYSVIKLVCCTEIPVQSQVILSKNLASKSKAFEVIRNVAMQLNCKLGGSLWSLQIPLKELIMFVGIDVYHDVKKLSPSVVALIASLNNSCTRYYSRANIQKVHQEITDNIEALFMEVLESYREVNGCFPDRIIIFRDGGSLASMKLLYEHEVKPVVRAINKMCLKTCKFSYILVSKRVPQRFFTTSKIGAVVTPSSGTVVDSSITYPNMFDFYVVSQDMRHAVINPTHYMVIYDTSNATADLFQHLAHATTFMYFNQHESIRVPAMIQYAHKLSSLVGQYIKCEPSRKLDKYLYYL